MEPLGRVYLHEVSRDAFSQREAEPCQPLGVQVMQPSWGVLSVLLLWVLQGFTKVPLRIPHRSYKDVVGIPKQGASSPLLLYVGERVGVLMTMNTLAHRKKDHCCQEDSGEQRL